MKLNQVTIGLVCLFSALANVSSQAIAATPVLSRERLEPSLNQAPWYYEIGGAQYIRLPQVDRTRIKVDPGLSWNGNLMCSNIDPQVSFDQFMNGVKRGWIKMQRNAVTAVQGTVASLPGLALQHIDPGLYEMISTGFIQAEQLFQIDLANCRSITSDLAKNKPNYDYVKVSGYEWMRDMFNDGNGQPKKEIQQEMGSVVSNAEEDLGKNGVDWVCGKKAGGDGQQPITGSDVLVSAYNKMIDRDACDKGVVAAAEGETVPSFVGYWGSPEIAKKWFNAVLGETKIYTSPNKKPLEQKVGTGLMPVVEETQKEVYQKLADLVQSDQVPTLKQLREVSFTDTLITRQIIQALRDDPAGSELASRLSLDVALQREMMRALEMRRLLIIGSEIDVVVAKKPSKEMVNQYIERLSREITMVREEIEIRKSLIGSTTPYLLRRDSSRKVDATSTVSSPYANPGVN